MLKNKSSVIKLAVILILFILILLWIIWGNTALKVTEYIISNSKLPSSFDGFRIAQVSDLHNTEFGENNSRLLEMLKESDPDIIVITGDLIDSRNTDTDVALRFVKEAIEIAPCYFITGNHEANAEEYKDFKKDMISLGVHVLENESVSIALSGEKISLIGVDDPFLQKNDNGDDSYEIMDKALEGISIDRSSFSVLLSHRPECFEIYTNHKIDLVLSGHAHGGQFRIPFIGGVYVPSQGFFPKYDAGLFTKDSTSMIVSCGIGNSAFPVRINNRPEIVIIELKKA